jgi:hypothetical protein
MSRAFLPDEWLGDDIPEIEVLILIVGIINYIDIKFLSSSIFLLVLWSGLPTPPCEAICGQSGDVEKLDILPDDRHAAFIRVIPSDGYGMTWSNQPSGISQLDKIQGCRLC